MLGNEAELKINSVTADMFDNTYKCVISDKFAKQEYSFRIKEKTYNEVSPSFYKITRKGNCVELRWTPAKEAVGYRLYIWDGVNKKYNVIHKNLKTNYYNFTGLKSGTEYKFAVKAYTIYKGQVLWSDVFTTVNVTTK